MKALGNSRGRGSTLRNIPIVIGSHSHKLIQWRIYYPSLRGLLSARSYDVRVVALTIDAPVKWVDNLLSHHEVPGCSGGKQGVARRITDLGLGAIAIVRLLAVDLGIPVSNAVALVRDASTESGIGSLRTAAGTRIEMPIGFAEALRERLLDALQAAPRRARGRPPRDR